MNWVLFVLHLSDVNQLSGQTAWISTEWKNKVLFFKSRKGLCASYGIVTAVKSEKTAKMIFP